VQHQRRHTRLRQRISKSRSPSDDGSNEGGLIVTTQSIREATRQAFNEYRQWRYRNDPDYRESRKLQSRAYRRGQDGATPLDLTEYATSRKRNAKGQFLKVRIAD